MRDNRDRMKEAVIVAFIALSLILLATKAWSAELVDTERLMRAIGKAENSYNHPFGIMRDYCKPGDPDGQCAKGCRQTIDKWKRKLDYKCPEEFIRKFAEIYAPTKNATNDPTGLNRNWYRNVWAFYSKNSH